MFFHCDAFAGIMGIEMFFSNHLPSRSLDSLEEQHHFALSVESCPVLLLVKQLVDIYKAKVLATSGSRSNPW